jgi:diaminohydroxyphosphoribosylaminopyrimidine deaminase/5-amino-6-(5-phosphoribosylamino)uracil reductase
MELKTFERWMDFPINHSHELYMKRAMELARLGSGYVSPNPLVGCVIVHQGRIIGEGWHKKYGQAHAEVNAIEAVSDKSILKESTLYVNLEPCSHTGKTPPCANLIIDHQLSKVILANADSNPLVGGKGIQRLRDAGITVIPEVLSKEGHELNKRFFTYMECKRPYIILKWAETSDGFIARKNNDSRWISDEYSRQLVHKWRTEEDAVLVGSGTAWYDNPMLNVRDWSGRDPVRIVIDRHLKLGPNLNVFNGNQPTICYNLVKDEARKNLLFVQLEPENFVRSLVQNLYTRHIQSVLVEGGAQILNSFIKAGLWDEARIFISPQQFHTGIASPKLCGVLREERKLQNDWLRILIPPRSSG